MIHQTSVRVFWKSYQTCQMPPCLSRTEGDASLVYVKCPWDYFRVAAVSMCPGAKEGAATSRAVGQVVVGTTVALEAPRPSLAWE